MWNAGHENFGGDGGFVPGGGGGSHFDSPARGAEKPKSAKRAQNIVPVTIKELLECHEETLVIVGTEAQVLTIVGLVIAVDQTTTKVCIQLDDQTGVIECVNYVGSDGATVSDIPFVPMEGSYGRVVGALRSTKGKKYLVIFKYLPVTDMNEVTAHMLEVIQVPMRLKKLQETEAQKTGVGFGLNNTMPNSMVTNSFASGAGMMPVRQQKQGFNQTQNMVLSIMQQNNQTESGMHKDEILRNMQGKIGMKELEKILEDLSNEGHVYSTVDDDHFRSTD